VQQELLLAHASRSDRAAWAEGGRSSGGHWDGGRHKLREGLRLTAEVLRHCVKDWRVLGWHGVEPLEVLI